ncbi:hypothetical protein [Flavobacterium sp.]|uniref:hypothetical protein n=1 Tax=Flavobacterium sp. TaxID=239 RepID=UPI004033B07D
MSKEFKISPHELNERLQWPLEDKIEHAIYKFLEFYLFYKGHVYQSFSGGKDSQTLDEIIQGIFEGKWREQVIMCLIDILNLDTKEKWDAAYQEIIIEKKYGIPPKVFCDTGLEFPEIRKHVKTFDGTIWLKPKMKFPDVIKNVGVAVGSKKVAMQVSRLINYLANPTPENEATRNLYLTGIKKDGTKSKSFGLTKRWLGLLNAPFKTSDKCCDIFKKEPWERYYKETGRKPITATTVSESLQRRGSYLQTGCNTFDKGKEMCRPFSIFTDDDVWKMAELYKIRFCEVYYDRIVNVPDGTGGYFEVFVSGEKRTGCMFCLFGIHLEPKDEPNRFQRLAITHPKQYQFMVDQCGLGIVLDFIGVKYKATKETFFKVKQYDLFQ